MKERWNERNTDVGKKEKGTDDVFFTEMCSSSNPSLAGARERDCENIALGALEKCGPD